MVRDAARRFLTMTGLFEAKPERNAPDHHAEGAPAGADQRRTASGDEQATMREREQDVMQPVEMPTGDVQPGEQQEDDRDDYFDFAPEPPPETEGVERPEGEDDPALHEPVLE